MKIEKLTEDKIRVIMDFKDIKLDKNDFFENMVDSQGIFIDILEKAEKEVDFHTEGCKLLIEAFSTLEDIIVFTITKFSASETKSNINSNKKKVIVKRKKRPRKSLLLIFIRINCSIYYIQSFISYYNAS